MTRWMLLLALAAPAWAGTLVTPPAAQPGSCMVTDRAEAHAAGLRARRLVVCRWPGADVTGDGVPEVVETVLVLRRNGRPDCKASSVNVLDVTRERYQAVSVAPAC